MAGLFAQCSPVERSHLTPPTGFSLQQLSIAVLTPSVSRTAGGIFEVERRLAQCLAAIPGVSVEVFGASDEASEEDAPLWPPIKVNKFPYVGPQQFRWSPALNRAFGECRADVAHLHVLWMFPSIVMRKWARRQHKPYVTTLHGMLDPWALRNAGWKKRISAAAYERDCLNRAGCIHAFSKGELASARRFGLRNPICVIPNGVDLPESSGHDAPWVNQTSVGKKTLLYLGRIHPKKNLTTLLAAWSKLVAEPNSATSDWQLVIAGWDQKGHERDLKASAKSLGIERNVLFVGPLFGDAKTAAYEHADAMVLPSLSEGLPMVVLEAWSHAKPVVMTPQCNLPEGFACDAAISSEPNVESLAIGLRELLSASDCDRKEMGNRGLALVQRKFTWAKVAAEMYAVYSWLVGGGSPPNCVVHN